jgi:precorrin-6A/cobalt-precorrin-6A reductase
MGVKVLILGGTSNGRELAERLASDARHEPLLSFAGRTHSLQAPRVPARVGGFGGAEGLAAFLVRGGFQALVDATHAFAAQISSNAVRASDSTGTPLLRLEQPAWTPSPGDRWLDAADMVAAATLLGAAPRRVFLAIGRLELAAFEGAPQHEYLIRAVDDFVPELPRARVLALRGPFELATERALLVRERIDVVVSKNAGTPSTYAKLAAARELGLPVVMVARPRLPPAETVHDVAAALVWLESLESPQRGSSTRRGV